MRNASPETRQYYRDKRLQYQEKAAEIPRNANDALARGADLEDTAHAAHDSRAALKGLERESLPPEVRARLEASDKSAQYVQRRGVSFEDRVQSYMREGRTRDEALHKIIEQSGKTNADMDAALRGPYPGD